MLGRVRASSWSSLEVLEIERTASSKLIKDDCLSIYETTLMKLKQGSRHDLILNDVGPTETDIKHVGSSIPPEGKDSMALDADCSSTAASPGSSECQSLGTSNEHQNKNVSVVDLFSKYMNSRHALSSPDQKAKVVENGCFSLDTSRIPKDSHLVSGAR